MIAVKLVTPNMPKLEMVNVPPWYSSGFNLLSLAFLTNSLVTVEMLARPRDPASLTIGVMRPVGVATATEMSAL